MRDRRRRRATETRGRDQGSESGATGGGGVLSWVRKHIVGSIVGAAIAVSVTGWLGGFFDSALRDVFPSGADAYCALKETIKYQGPFAGRPPASDKFTILISTIDYDDAKRNLTRAIGRAFRKQGGIERIDTCRVLRLSGVGSDAGPIAAETARKWLRQRHADLLIGGELLKENKAVNLWFISTDSKEPFEEKPFYLNDHNDLGKDFDEKTLTRLQAVALASIRPAAKERGEYLANTLQPYTKKIRYLIEETKGLSDSERTELQEALGIVFLTIGDQAGDNQALVEAVKAYDAVLRNTGDRRSFQWAMTQRKRGNALRILGERAGNTKLLEEAAKAYRTALEVFERDRAPLEWAASQNGLGIVLTRLAEQEQSKAKLKEAVEAYSAALQVWKRELMPLDWASTQNNAGYTLRTLGELERSTQHLEKAVRAHEVTLTVYKPEQMPRDWASTQNNLGSALQALGELEKSTQHLEKAVKAYEATLAVYKPEQMPVDWAGTQNNLGNALRALGELEQSVPRLEKAVEAHKAALKGWTRERVPFWWAMAQNNFAKTLRSLGEREAGTKRLEDAIIAWDECLEFVVAKGIWPAAKIQYVRGLRNEAATKVAQRSAK